jgi:ComEC/Rec2-related protein
MLFPWAMCFFLTGMGINSVSEIPLANSCALITAGILIALIFRNRRFTSIILVATFLPLGALIGATGVSGSRTSDASEDIRNIYGTDTPVTLYGTVVHSELQVHFKRALNVRVSVIESRGTFTNIEARVLVFLQDEMAGFNLGDEIAVDCVFGDFTRYLRSAQVKKYRIDAWCFAQRGGVRHESPSSVTVRMFYSFKNALLNNLEEGLSEEYGGLYQGIVFGKEVQRLKPEFHKDFYSAGMNHLLVASGAQVALIIFPFFTLYNRFRGKWLKIALFILMGAAMILLYLIVGHVSSILRAISVGYILLIGKALGRPTHALNSLSIAGLMWLVYDPSLLNNFGFQLSYFASFGILYMAPILVEWIENRFPKALRGWGPRTPVHMRVYLWVKRNVIYLGIISIASQWGVLPIIAYKLKVLYFNGIAANIIAVPLGSVALVVGAISSIAGFIHPILSEGLNYAAWPFLTAMIGLARFFGSMEFLRISHFYPPLAAIITYYAGTIILIEILRKNTEIVKLVSRLRRGDLDLTDD